ncbi:MAG TPA: Rne/Rng family ribonuclease [Clostridia bacterium]|nr:Rne/Rng family ribonuclease [Clostridia bacterium]
MTKELYVSSTPRETKVALVEDDQLAEVYFERENEYTLAGSIYKGRVTRVLPGMQSAFVDIGLERDAFLYVSDFLELPEDEDEDFGEVAIPVQIVETRQHDARQATLPTEPLPAESGAEDEEGDEEEVTANGGEEEEQPAENPEDPGVRRWRGRRRRRGRRGGRTAEPHPASAETAEPETVAESAPEVVEEIEEVEPAPPQAASTQPSTRANFSGMADDYQPMILPGESIARYQRGEGEPRNEVFEQEPAPQERKFGDRDRKFGGRGRRGERGERERQPREPRSREEAAPLPADYQPIILPGESISKYRNAEPQAFAETTEYNEQSASVDESVVAAPDLVATEAAADDRTNREYGIEENLAPEAVAPTENAGISPFIGDEPNTVSEPEIVPAEGIVSVLPAMAAAEEPVTTPETPSHQQQVEEAAAPAAEAREAEPRASEPTTPEPHGIVEESCETSGVLAAQDETPTEADEEVAQRFHDMNVAAIFGGGAVEDADAESTGVPEHAVAPENAASPESSNAPEADRTSMQDQGGYSPRGGELVHEELDEDEADMPNLGEDLTGYQLHELEERTLDRIGGHEIGEANDREANNADEDYDFDGDSYEFEESELVAGEEDQDEEEEEGEESEETNGQAELRAPAGTAGYQQRAERPARERRPNDRDRDHRGRRGGRRMRGGPRHEAPRAMPMISDLLKEGQEVLIQIAKEPIGKKGARITSHIALPGRFLVFMPTVNHIGVSRKIASEEERQRLKRIVASERENGHGGFIVRTAAANVREDELRADIRFLKHLWNEIRTRADSSKSPALIYHDLNLVERVLRDQVTQDFSQIWVDTEQEYERVVRFASRFQPGLLRRIKLYTKDTPLFEQFGIQDEINKSLKSKVWLKSGGYIVINQTEALVAIDINTGKYVGKTQRLEDTIVKTNVDAIKEIVRQVRLRDLGGIIVIDFIDMDERKNRQKVMQALEEALKSDRAPSKVLQFNDFGLVAITRKRVKQSLERTLGSPCPYCAATGFVKSVATVCNEIYTEMRKITKHLESRDVTLRVHPDVAKELKSSNGRWLQEMEELVGRPVLIKSDPALHQEQFDINT